MADPVDHIRAALRDVIAETCYIAMSHDGGPILMRWVDQELEVQERWRGMADDVLAVVESWVPTKPCPECAEVGLQTDDDPCETCDGTGEVPPDPSDVPGIIELLMEKRGYDGTPEPFLWDVGDEKDALYRLRREDRPVSAGPTESP